MRLLLTIDNINQSNLSTIKANLSSFLHVMREFRDKAIRLCKFNLLLFFLYIDLETILQTFLAECETRREYVLYIG